MGETWPVSSYEEQVALILKKERIKFYREKTYSDLKHGKYRYDFYLPIVNFLIEVDGQYHFFPIRGLQELKKQQEHDRRKNSYALAHNIQLFRIPYWDLESGAIKTFNDLIQKKYHVVNKWHNDRIKVPKN